jgi:hypothetical protein
MPPTPTQQPEDYRAKIEEMRAKQKEKEEAELAAINAERATRGEPPLTELPQVVISHDSGRQRPSPTPAVTSTLTPRGKTGAAWSGMNDDRPEIVPDPLNPGQFITKDPNSEE